MHEQRTTTTKKITNMETELAEMKLLLAQPEPTINYCQPKHLDDYYFVTPILRVDKAIYSANH